MRVLSDAHDPERTLFERMLFHRRAAFLGPCYFAEQLGHRKIMDATCMIAAMINGAPDSEDVKPITIPGVARVAARYND